MSEAIPTTNTSSANSDTPPATREDDELDVEVAALLARGAQDMGAATETVRLDTLTEAEKRVLLALLRERLEHAPISPEPVPAKENQP